LPRDLAEVGLGKRGEEGRTIQEGRGAKRRVKKEKRDQTTRGKEKLTDFWELKKGEQTKRKTSRAA